MLPQHISFFTKDLTKPGNAKPRDVPMTHSVCTLDADEVLPYFQHLCRTLLDPNVTPRTRLERLFDRETDEFDLDFAFLSYIDLGSETERFEVVHGSHESLQPDTTVPLSKTYCRKTIADPEGTLAVSDALAEGWDGDPAYETFELGSYLGTTVSAEDELYGTLCFADTAARDDPFLEKEKALLELYGQWVEYVLTIWVEPLIREMRLDTIEGRDVSWEAIDSMMDALQSRNRRVILMSLVGGTTETSLASLEDQAIDRIRQYHVHLPKLADAGYIEWDTEAETISRGPKFAEVEPLVQLLNEYDAEFSE